MKTNNEFTITKFEHWNDGEWEDLPELVKATLTTELGSVDLLEWVDNGHVVNNRSESNINLHVDLSALFGSDFDDNESDIMDAIYSELQGKLDTEKK